MRGARALMLSPSGQLIGGLPLAMLDKTPVGQLIIFVTLLPQIRNKYKK